NAEAGTDYSSLAQVLTFTSGSGTSQTVAGSTIVDTAIEGTEDYRVTIGGQSVGDLGTSETQTNIADDDASNLIWNLAGPSAVAESESATYTVSYTGATLAPGQTAPITMPSGYPARCRSNAEAGTDYSSLAQVLT